MAKISELIDGLMDIDHQHAYKCLQGLEAMSRQSADIYPYFNRFVEMLDSANSYVRTRGIVLLAANAKWDIDYKMDEITDEYLQHILDDKPITARQCIRVLPTIAKFKPNLKRDIEIALRRANPSKYKDSMYSLISEDIRGALNAISKL